MSDSSDASSTTSRPPRAGYGNPPLWVPGHQHGSEATSGFGLTTHYEPSTNQHQDMRAQHQQFIQTDTNPFHRPAGVPTVNDLLNQPASYSHRSLDPWPPARLGLWAAVSGYHVSHLGRLRSRT